MKWEGPYHVKCPKCGGRNIWLNETCEGVSEHLIKNGIWDRSHDNNDYGMITKLDCKCDDCGHWWTKRGVTMEYYHEDEIKERRNRKHKKINIFDFLRNK